MYDIKNCMHVELADAKGKAYTNPKSRILQTPSQKIKYKWPGDKLPNGSWAIDWKYSLTKFEVAKTKSGNKLIYSRRNYIVLK